MNRLVNVARTFHGKKNRTKSGSFPVCGYGFYESQTQKPYNARFRGFDQIFVSGEDYPTQGKDDRLFSHIKTAQLKASARAIITRRASKERSWLDLIAKISDLLILGTNWDGNGADSPTPIAVRNTIRIATELSKSTAVPKWSAPTADSGVSICCELSGKIMTWEVDHDGEIGLKEEGAGEPKYRGVELGEIASVLAGATNA